MSDNDDIEVESDVSPTPGTATHTPPPSPTPPPAARSAGGKGQRGGGVTFRSCFLPPPPHGPGSLHLPLPLPPSRAPLRRNSRGFNPRPTNGLITTRWSASAGTTSRTVSTACGTLSPPSRERRHPGPKSWTKPQSTSSTCAGKTTRTSRTSTTSKGKTLSWSSKCARWRRPGRAPSSKPTTPRRTTASTPTPRAAPSPLSTAAPTPAPIRNPTSHRAGRSCAWRPVRPPRGLPCCSRPPVRTLFLLS